MKIQVIFEDLINNHWSTLFKVANEELNETDVYYSAIGRSFFGQVTHSSTIDIAFSGSALHWASQTLALKNVFTASRTHDPIEKEQWNLLSKKDWETIIKYRSRELSPNALLIANFMINDSKQNPQKWAETLENILDTLVQQNKITKQEVESLVLPAHSRKLSDITDPELMMKYGFEVLFSNVYIILNPFYEKLQKELNQGRPEIECVRAFAKESVAFRRYFI